MELILAIIFAVSSFGALILSWKRYQLELKRFENNVWETTVRLMASDPDSRVRADDFADLYTALRFLEKNPDCTKDGISLRTAIHNSRQESKNQTPKAQSTK